MAGFFYLGGRDNKQDNHHQQQQQQQDKSNYLYLYKDEIYNTNKGFEIWPPQYFQQQQQQQQQHVSAPTNFFSFGMVPSTSNNNNTNRSSGRSLYFDVVSDQETGGGFTVTRSQGGMNCQDCGNQAKKDCPHMRCRTCCKSRGFHCQTHVKSTWVPAAKRRERLAQLSSLQHNSISATSTSRDETQNANAKRLREDKDHSGGSGSGLALGNITRVVNTNSNSGLEMSQNLPPEINSPAVFRCVKVSSMEEDQEEDDQEYAYQTAVNIGGHVFKGILYDQGLDQDHQNHNHQLNLLASTATTSNAQETVAKTAVTFVGNNNNGLILDHSSLYPSQLNSYLAGTPFFTPPRP
ncbi:unnamed protein product [Cochlearia groenlandica]